MYGSSAEGGMRGDEGAGRAGSEDHGAGDGWVDLREIVVEHHREIFRLARSLTRSNADAEDLAQTAVVRALQRGAIVSDAEQAKWYVLRIVRNLAIDQARSRGRVVVEPWSEVPEQTSDDLAPDDVVERDAAEERVPRAAFAELADADREVLRLRFLEELAYDEVAARLHTTPHGARQRVYRAMQALRSAVTDRRYRPTN
jgi:RNA polymerase sigma-70 factor, ECF subfamily